MLLNQEKTTKQAAHWFLRMQHAEPDHPERSKFEAWLFSSQSNADAYKAISMLWENFDEKSGLDAIATAIQNSQKNASLKSKTRSKLFNSVAGLVLLAITGLLGFKLWNEWQNQVLVTLASATAIGEMKQQQLNDGSHLTLNSNTILQVTYYRNKRVVELKRGEVIFNVVKDVDRPFIVDSDFAKVTVLGTRFVVNKLNNVVRVSVDHGRVKVESQHAKIDNNLTEFAEDKYSQSAIILSNGQVAEVQQLQAPKRTDKNALDAFGFAEDTIAFEQAGLQEIAEVLSRYLKTPVSALPSAKNVTKDNLKKSDFSSNAITANDPKVTALVQIKDLQKFMYSLPHIAPIKVTEKDGKILLSAK